VVLIFGWETWVLISKLIGKGMTILNIRGNQSHIAALSKEIISFVLVLESYTTIYLKI
jgi:hypothetical protein